VSRGGRVRWTRRASRDLLEIARFIARDDRGAARRWVEKLREQAARAALQPLAGRRVPEVPRDDVRETFLRSYRIIYRVLKSGVEILTVFEGHRQLPLGRVPAA